MLIEIVSHAWARDLPHYAHALRYQLSSIALHPPLNCHVLVTVCYCPEDHETSNVLSWFADGSRRSLIRPLAFSRKQLGRRSIGRNVAALSSKADVVWFSDVDQVFYEGCLDRLVLRDLVGVWSDNVVMIYPKEIMIHQDHKTGDRALARATATSRLLDIDPEEFIPKKYNRAIGGVQIVRGDFAREHGYLKDNPRWQKERKDGKMFGDFRDDLAYRRYCRKIGRIQGVRLEGMYRLRHTQKTH